MDEVKQMVRTLAPQSSQENGLSSPVEVDYELQQYFVRGFELFAVQSLGDFKVGAEIFPRVLYVLTKSAVPMAAKRGRKPKVEEPAPTE